MSGTSLTLLFWTLALFVHLSFALPQGAQCRCNGRISDKGNGECKTTHQGLDYCYVTSGLCTDQQESSQEGWFWSFEACKEGKGTFSSGCMTTGGDDTGSSCEFPFIFKNEVYNGCTLAGADDDNPWCSTKVDSQGIHVSGEGKWGHCGQGCPQDEGSNIGLSTPQKECTCDDHTEVDDSGRETGNCLTQYRGSNWCYIHSSSKCGDKKQSSKYPSLFWSQIACQTNTESESVTTEERIRKNEERIRRKGNSTITNRSGSSSCTQFVTSPGFPGRYPSNFGPQETQIRVPDGHSIEITFQRFDIESCYWCSYRKCRWDWMEFKDGNGKLVGERLCGDDLPAAFTIPTSTASVSFRSDYSVQTTGYKICYESKPPGVKMECNFDDNELVPRGRSPHDVTGDFFWSNGRIPYVFTQTVGSEDKQLFLRVIQTIESKTCFKFTKLNSPPTAEKYLEITVDDTFDNSCDKGRFRAWVTNEYLQANKKIILRSKFKLADKLKCQRYPYLNIFEGLILHEFFHVLGVGHTQRRKDRNKYIEVLPNNILDYSQYDICNGCKIYPQIPYECNSIMHYGFNTIKRPGAGPTMTSRRSSCKINPGSSTVATDNDWKLLNIIADQVCGGPTGGSGAVNIVLTGGRGYNFLDSSDLISPREGKVCIGDIPPLPAGVRFSPQSAFIQNNLMVCGGKHLSPYKTCYLLRSSTSNWIEGPSMNIARRYFTITKVGNTLYALGGSSGSPLIGKDSDTMEKFEDNRWKLLTQKIPTPRSVHCTVYMKSTNSLVVIGGFETNAVESFDLLTGKWTKLASLPYETLSFPGCNVVKDTIYVAGGSAPEGTKCCVNQKNVWKYDKNLDTWKLAGQMKEARYGFGMIVIDGKLMAFGSGSGHGKTSIETMDDDEKWKLSPLKLSEGRFAYAMAAVPADAFPCP